MRFLHLYLGLHLMMETMFEKAGDYLLRAKVDPRLVVRLFPKLRGKVIGSAEEVDVLDGVKTVLEAMPPIEDIGEYTRSWCEHLLIGSSIRQCEAELQPARITKHIRSARDH